MDGHTLPPRKPMMSQLAVALFDYKASANPSCPVGREVGVHGGPVGPLSGRERPRSFVSQFWH
jgi:hypothetical protein